jgi:hypothetical protein
MDSQRIVELAHDRCRESADARTDTLDRHRPDLLCLRLRVTAQAGLSCREQYLERVDARSA